MKASMILTATGALLAAAGPIQERKLFTEIDVVTDWVTVTVTGEPNFFRGNRVFRTTKTPAPPPPPAPTTTSTTPPPPPPTTTEAPPPPPAPTTVKQEKVVVPAPEPAPVKEEVQEPAPAPAPAPGNDYQSVVIYHHNVHRLNHSAPEVTWSDKLATYARASAETCVFAHDMSQGDGKYGQNLAMKGYTNADPSATNKVTSEGISYGWYANELAKYPESNYESSSADTSNFSKWGHFSQMVWKGTTQVGCYTKFCEAGSRMGALPSFYTVCNYFPAGNNGAYSTNVLRPKGQPPVYV